MKIPPLLRQEQILDVLQDVPDVGNYKGLVMDMLCRNQDVTWVAEHYAEYATFLKLFDEAQ